ncbi:MAG: DUF262 domain-containing protein [Verrucomicrobiia bacterium]
MEAQNRRLTDWHGKIQRAEMKLPRFQRFEEWDRNRICSLLGMVIQNLPLGITLILEVGDEEKFVSRFLETAPAIKGRVYEHLLDGQQRLTALWRAFHNNYEWETYYVYLKEFDKDHKDKDREDMSVYWRGRYYTKNGAKYPAWCDDPEQCLRRGMIPTHLLRPEDMQKEIDDWIERATKPLEPNGGKEELKTFYDFKKRVSDRIKDLRSVVAGYNLPYLSLPAQTEKTVALTVFINMNTNSKPLSTYDIIVAEVEGVTGQALHDLEEGLAKRHPEVGRYAELSDLILTTSALLQGQLPNQRGAWNMDTQRMIDGWDTMEKGLTRVANFLKGEGIHDERRLPTNAVLAVIAALYADIPEAGDKRGQDELLLKKYLWHAFFTNRYENSAATHAFSDFNVLRGVIRRELKADKTKYTVKDVPIFAEHALAEPEELIPVEWPKRATIRGRGIMAVASRLGALDFSTGERLDANNIVHRHYHHVFPDALLREAEVESYVALNCALITDKTNISIGRKEPLQYLKDRYEWVSEQIVRERLQSHLIPMAELANGGYENLSKTEKQEKIKKDFDAFLRKRAELMIKAVKQLADGRQVSPAELCAE